jgi:hypothetical protein
MTKKPKYRAPKPKIMKKPEPPKEEVKLGTYSAVKIKLVKSLGSKLAHISNITWPTFNIQPTRNPLLSVNPLRSTKLQKKK